jgi:hypothetical protein
VTVTFKVTVTSIKKETAMKKINQAIKNAIRNVRNLLGRLLGAPTPQPALQPVPVRSRRTTWRK